MIVFNDLRIMDDGNTITANCAVEDLPAYDDIYIKAIYLDYYKNVSTYGVPSVDTSLKIYDNTGDDTSVKSKRIKVLFNQLVAQTMKINSFKNGLFYVIVKCDGELPANMALTPCGSDSMVSVGIILDWDKVYDKGMIFVNNLLAHGADFCGDTSMVSNVLVWHALMACIGANDHEQLERIWDMFLRLGTHSSSTVSRSGCGCK